TCTLACPEERRVYPDARRAGAAFARLVHLHGETIWETLCNTCFKIRFKYSVARRLYLEGQMNRRKMLGTIAKGTAAALAAPTMARVAAGASMINLGRYRLFAGTEKAYPARAVEIVQRSTVIDMLAPLWISPSITRKMLGNPDNFKAEDFAPYK